VGADRELVELIKADLKAAADPVRAPMQQAYMKSTMPCLGVRMPDVRAIAKARAKQRPPRSNAQLAATARALWRDAEYREYRYAASQLVDAPAARKLRTPEMLPVFEEFIVTGDWWDHVDETSRGVGDLLARYPDEVRPVIRSWITSDNKWLRRVSIICQLGRGADTDLELLAEAIDANATDTDFFIRKGIGWALRQYARTDPAWVRDFVARRTEVLSGLSKREALKHLG
jgi:3-methyladenine DNA glycosylase AlkD